MVGPKSFPPIIGGIETHVYEIAKKMSERGIKITVIVPCTDDEPRNASVQGVKVVRVPSISRRFTTKLTMIPFVIRELRKGKYDLVHAHDATSGFACAIFSPSPVVYTMHGLAFHPQDWPSPFRQGIQIMQWITLRRAEYVFCTDGRTADAIRGLRKKAEVLSSGVTPEEFSRSSLKRPAEYNNDRFILLFVGRLAKIKGVSILLQSIRALPQEARSKMSFIFIGDGPLMREVQGLERETDSVKALGVIDHSQIAPYFAHADAYILPSLSEGLPISLLEAMAAGLPSIASDVGGISSQIGPESVRLVIPGDTSSLTDAIMEIWKNNDLRNDQGQRGRQFVSENFTWDRVVDRILSVYGEVRRSRSP
jgi:glycosyltransferase involved in cell wall biosynthesis